MNYLSIYYYTNHDAIGSQLHTRLHLGLNHLGGHKLRQNFQDYVSPMCTCVQDIEKTNLFVLHHPNHHYAR